MEGNNKARRTCNKIKISATIIKTSLYFKMNICIFGKVCFFPRAFGKKRTFNFPFTFNGLLYMYIPKLIPSSFCLR